MKNILKSILACVLTALLIAGVSWAATLIPVSQGGTGASTASGARSNLGLGTIATQNVGTLTNTKYCTYATGTGFVCNSDGIGSMTYPDAGIALSTGSGWDTSIANNSSNWNTAYGWGNHASAGYLTSLSGALLATGATTGATSQAQAFTNGVITGKIYPSADSTTALQFNKADGTTNVLNVDTTNGRVGIGTTSPGYKFTVQSEASETTLGSNLLTNGDFATNDFTGWTAGANWSAATGAAVHTAGATEAISQNITVATGQYYQIDYDESGDSAGSLTFAIGAESVTRSYSQATSVTIKTSGATGTQTFSITPSSTYNGTLDNITIKLVTPASSPAFALLNADGTAGGVQIKAGGSGLNNIFIGSGSGRQNTTGNGNNGTLANGPKWTQGKEGGALQFDGKDDYVDCGNDSSLNITDAITVEALIKPNWSDTGNKEILIKAWNIDRLWATNINEIRTYNVIGGESKNHIVSNVLPITDGTAWYHIVYTYDGSVEKIYINAVEKGSWNASGLLLTTTEPLLIGIYSNKVIDPFNGLIDEVRIYNRALSAEEVRYHYNQGKPVGYWAFDEGEGTRAFDSSGNGNHGTISGATWVEGEYGSALSFSSDDYVSYGNDEKLNPTKQITISVWVKPDQDYIAGDNQWYARFASKNPVFIFGWQGWDDGLGYGIYDETITWRSGGFSQPLYQGNWYHVAYSFDGQYLKGYFNGQLRKTTNVGSHTINSSSSSLYAPINGYSFNGSMDDVRIYDYARTEEQILQDYNAGLGAHLK